MTYEKFLKIILSLQKEDKTIKTLYGNGVDLIDFVDPYHKIINELITEIYGEDGYQWFSWYCNENQFGEKDWSTTPLYKENKDGTTEKIKDKGEVRFGAYDDEGNPICYSHESLWGYLELYCKPFTVQKRRFK